MSNINFFNANPDVNNSTFHHIFNYDCGSSIPGYSKKEGFAESKDKRSVLAGVLHRLFNRNYFESPNIPGQAYGKFISLEIFENSSKNGWSHIATLYKDYLDLNSDAINPDISNLLWHFQREIKNGSISESFESKFRKSKNTTIGDLELKHRFYDRLQVQNHCKRLINQGKWPVNRVQEFYKDYCNRYFNGFTDEDQKFYDSLKFYKS